LRCRGVDRDEPPVRMACPYHAHVELMGKRDVVGETSATGQQRQIFNARHGSADIGALAGLGHAVPSSIGGVQR
jgi:hypothetical protein